MRVERIESYKGGWFVGNFDPAIFKTEAFEVGTTLHPKGSDWPRHYHKLATEITYIVSGVMEIDGTILNAGDVFIIEPYEVVKPTFIEDCQVIVIKTPSVPGDKYVE